MIRQNALRKQRNLAKTIGMVIENTDMAVILMMGDGIQLLKN